MNKRLLALLALPLITGLLYLRSLVSWRPQKIFVGTRQITHLVFSDDGRTLLVGYGQAGRINGVPPHRTLVALDAGHGFAVLWQRPLNASFVNLNSPQFFDHDRHIFVVGEKTTEELDARTGKTRRTFGPYWQAVISPNGRWIASGANRHVRLQRVDTSSRAMAQQAPLKTWGGPHQQIDQFAFSPDGHTLLLGVGDQSGAHLDFYDTRTWKRTASWQDMAPPTSSQHQIPSYLSLRWSRNGRFLFSSWECQHKGKPSDWGAHLWRMSDGRKLAYSRWSSGLVQNDGRVLSTVGIVSLVRRHAPNLDYAYEPLLDSPLDGFTNLAVAPDDSYLVAGTGSGIVYRKRLK